MTDRDFLSSHLYDTTVEPSPSFDAGVHRRVRRIRRFQQIRSSSLQLILVGLLGVAAWQRGIWQSLRYPDGPPQQAAARAGSVWLVQQQAPDGQWNAADGGGHPSYSPGVSALATLALLHAPDPVDSVVLERADRYLQKSLDASVQPHAGGPELYNRLLSLNTLIELQQRYPQRQRKQLIDRELSFLLRRQQPDGGWGYLNDDPFGYGATSRSTSNSAVTWWVCHLLQHAPGPALPGVANAQERGKDWLAQRSIPQSGVAYQPGGPVAQPDDALFWMAARNLSQVQNPPTTDIQTPDAYRDLFRTRVLGHPEPLQSVYAGQAVDGGWMRTDDRWWKAGGRIYLTAVSLLSLVPQGGV